MRKVPFTPEKQGSEDILRSENAEDAENADTKTQQMRKMRLNGFIVKAVSALGSESVEQSSQEGSKVRGVRSPKPLVSRAVGKSEKSIAEAAASSSFRSWSRKSRRHSRASLEFKIVDFALFLFSNSSRSQGLCNESTHPNGS